MSFSEEGWPELEQNAQTVPEPEESEGRVVFPEKNVPEPERSEGRVVTLRKIHPTLFAYRGAVPKPKGLGCFRLENLRLVRGRRLCGVAVETGDC
jgi:hypothetical protein